MGNIDLALRSVATRHPYDIARQALPDVTPETPLVWLDTQHARAELRLDKGMMVTRATGRVVIHHEWELDADGDVGYRVHRYRNAIDEACRAKDDEEAERAPKETPKPTPATVLSTVVMLRGPERVTRDRGEYRNAPQEAPFSGTVYLIDRVYQRTVDELLTRPGRFWTVFTPFARDASRETVGRAVQAVRERAQSRDDFVDLAAALAVMAAGSSYVGDLQEWIMSTLGNDLVESSLLWQKALGKGLKEGLKEGRKKGRKEGREEGRLAALRGSLRAVLAARGLRVTEAQRARIDAADDAKALEAWLQAAVTAKTTGEALRASPARSHG